MVRKIILQSMLYCNSKFSSLKNITTGEGIAIITNNYKIYNKINKLRNHSFELSRSKIFWDKEVNGQV